jgi:hypothetical protein
MTKPSSALVGSQAKEGHNNHRPRKAKNIIETRPMENNIERKPSFVEIGLRASSYYALTTAQLHGSAIRS